MCARFIEVAQDQDKPQSTRWSEPVAPACHMIVDERTELGVRKYGQPLHTFDGRDNELDVVQEAADHYQYAVKRYLESKKSLLGKLELQTGTIELRFYPKKYHEGPAPDLDTVIHALILGRDQLRIMEGK